jgi:hypothetical protein
MRRLGDERHAAGSWWFQYQPLLGVGGVFLSMCFGTCVVLG